MRVPRDLGPRTFGEVLDGTFLLYRRHFGLLMLLTLIVSAMSLIGAALTAEDSGEALANYFRVAMRGPQGPGNDAAMVHFRNLMNAASEMQVMILAQAVFQAVSRGGSLAVAAIVVADLLAGRGVPTAGNVLRRALPRLPATIFGPFLLQSVVGALACLCLPLYVAFAALVLAQPVIATVEIGRFEARIRASMQQTGRFSSLPGKALLYAVILPLVITVDSTMRCCSLSWHLPAIGRATAFMMLLYGCGFVLQSVLGSGIAWFDRSLESAFWAQHYGELLILPAYGIGATLWYADLLVRRDGADLERTLEELREGTALA